MKNIQSLDLRFSSAVCLIALCSLPGGAFAATSPQPNDQMNAVLNQLQAKGGKPIETLSAADARKQPTPSDAVKDLIVKKQGDAKAEPVAQVEDRQIDGAAGKIPARIYTPEGKGPMPIVVYYHGGGFVIATNQTYDSTPRALANQAKAIVVSVEYRKGPENKFPAAHDDAFAAYQWVLKNAASFGGDPKRVAVAGESAGGNLALNVAIRARDTQIQLPLHELLVYPVAGTDMQTASYQENANAKPLSKPMMGWFMKNYTRSPQDAQDPRLNLLQADLHGLKPATVITAQIDPLRSEGKALADRMKAQGVSVNYKNYDGVTHEFFGMAAVLDQAKDAQKIATSDLKNAFSG